VLFAAHHRTRGPDLAVHRRMAYGLQMDRAGAG
jgi:hypothetical protein